MRIINRHLLGQLLGVTLLGTLLLAALVFLLQALRLGHHLAGSGAELSLLVRALLLSTPSLLTFGLPLAAAAAVLLVWGRLADTQQLAALQAAGASPLQLAWPVLQLLLLTGALTAGIGHWLEPASLQRLQTRLLDQASAALLAGLRPGQFQALSPELTIFAESHQRSASGQAHLERLFLARQHPAQQLLARQALLRASSGAALDIELRDGELRQADGKSLLEQVRFGRARLRLSLAEGLAPHLGFLSLRAAEAPRRSLLAAASGLAMALLALLAATRVRRPALRGLLGLAVVGALQGVLLVLPSLAGLVLSIGVALLALLALCAPPFSRVRPPLARG